MPWNKNRTYKICNRHGKLDSSDIGLIINNLNPVQVSTRCLICERERIQRRYRENGRFSENSSKKFLQCALCKIKKPPNMFTKSELKKITSYRCKECISNYNAAFNLKKHHKQIKIYRLRTRYNIDLQYYDKLFYDQKGVCAICKNTESKIRPKDGAPYDLSIDHCHITGNIRGLLCKKCNLMIGNAGDSAINLRNGANYLDNHA